MSAPKLSGFKKERRHECVVNNDGDLLDMSHRFVPALIMRDQFVTTLQTGALDRVHNTLNVRDFHHRVRDRFEQNHPCPVIDCLDHLRQISGVNKCVINV